MPQSIKRPGIGIPWAIKNVPVPSCFPSDSLLFTCLFPESAYLSITTCLKRGVYGKVKIQSYESPISKAAKISTTCYQDNA